MGFIIFFPPHFRSSQGWHDWSCCCSYGAWEVEGLNSSIISTWIFSSNYLIWVSPSRYSRAWLNRRLYLIIWTMSNSFSRFSLAFYISICLLFFLQQTNLRCTFSMKTSVTVDLLDWKPISWDDDLYNIDTRWFSK